MSDAGCEAADAIEAPSGAVRCRSSYNGARRAVTTSNLLLISACLACFCSARIRASQKATNTVAARHQFRPSSIALQAPSASRRLLNGEPKTSTARLCE